MAKPYPRGLLRAIVYGRTVRFTAFGRDNGLNGDGAGLDRGVPTSITVRDWDWAGPRSARARASVVLHSV